MRLSLHQLNVLLCVKQKKSITQAAQALHMTQPAVSNIVKQLETLYQTKLTKLNNRQTLLTTSGMILADTAATIERLLHEAENHLKAENNILSGKLSVAVVSTAKYFVPRLLAAFKKQHPSIKIRLTVANREEIIKRLNENQDDIVIMSQPPKHKKFIIKNFYDDNLVVIASANTTLNRKNPYQLSDLENSDWLMREPGSGTRMVIKQLFKANKMKPTVISEVGNNEAIKQLVIADMGISIVSLQSVELELDNNLIKILPVKDFPKTHRWYMVKKQEDVISEAVEEFDRFVSSHSDLAHFHSWKATENLPG